MGLRPFGLAAAGRCPQIDWAAGGGGGGGGGGDADGSPTPALPPAASAPAVLALTAAALATTAALRSRVAAAVGDPALLLGADPAPLAAYGLLWGLAPCVDGKAVAAVAALEAALAEG